MRFFERPALFFATIFLTCALFLVALQSCKATPAHAMSLFKDRPTEAVVNPIATPTPAPVPGLDGPTARLKLLEMSVGSACSKSVHGEVKNAAGKVIYGSQGTPPPGYMRGIALTAARAACNPDLGWVKVAAQPIGLATKDFIAHYGLKPATAEERIDMTFSVMIGSAAREASWRWCVGRDVNAKESDRKACVEGTGSTCEAGNYQSSQNSISAHSVLAPLFAHYQGASDGCFAVEYKGKTTCSDANLKNWGTSATAQKFQQLQKHCPGYAAEHHAVMLRTVRTHYGPVNQKASFMKPVCQSLFSEVRKFVQDNPSVCAAL